MIISDAVLRELKKNPSKLYSKAEYALDIYSFLVPIGEKMSCYDFCREILAHYNDARTNYLVSALALTLIWIERGIGGKICAAMSRGFSDWIARGRED